MKDLPEPLRQAVARAGWTKLMPVQARAMPYLLAGRDLMVQSRTGSGKTGAFLLPILDRVDPKRNVCQALVLVPTRELAHQVAEEAKIAGRRLGLRTVVVYGGVGYGPQIEALSPGRAPGGRHAGPHARPPAQAQPDARPPADAGL